MCRAGCAVDSVFYTCSELSRGRGGGVVDAARKRVPTSISEIVEKSWKRVALSRFVYFARSSSAAVRKREAGNNPAVVVKHEVFCDLRAVRSHPASAGRGVSTESEDRERICRGTMCVAIPFSSKPGMWCVCVFGVEKSSCSSGAEAEAHAPYILCFCMTTLGGLVAAAGLHLGHIQLAYHIKTSITAWSLAQNPSTHHTAIHTSALRIQRLPL